MSKLLKNQDLLAQIIKARTLSERIKGLIPFKSLSEKEVFWIPYCQSVHTFFMRFPLDVIFTDKRFQIVKFFEKASSKRILFGGFKSRHVFEAQAGFIFKQKLKKGDQLHVEP